MSGTPARDSSSLRKSTDPEKAHSVDESPVSLDKYDKAESYDESTVDPLAQFTDEEVKRAWRKVDYHILPVAVLLYLSSYIDRFVTQLL